MGAIRSGEDEVGSDNAARSQSQDLYNLSNLPKNHLWFWIGQKMEPEAPLFQHAYGHHDQRRR